MYRIWFTSFYLSTEIKEPCARIALEWGTAYDLLMLLAWVQVTMLLSFEWTVSILAPAFVKCWCPSKVESFQALQLTPEGTKKPIKGNSSAIPTWRHFGDQRGTKPPFNLKLVLHHPSSMSVCFLNSQQSFKCLPVRALWASFEVRQLLYM